MLSSTSRQTQESDLDRLSYTTILMRLGWIAAALCASSVAAALPPCNEDEMTIAENYCEDTFGYAVLACGIAESGNLAVECCPYGHCDADPIGPHYLDLDEEWTEDDEREDPSASSSESEDADPLSERDSDISEEDDDPVASGDEDAQFEDDESDDENAGDTGLFDEILDHEADEIRGHEYTLVAEDGRLVEDAAFAEQVTDAGPGADLTDESREAEGSAGCSTIGPANAGWASWAILMLIGLTRRSVRSD